MRIRINQLAGFGVLLGFLGALPALSDTASESGPTDVDGRWIPSFSIEGGVMVQEMGSSVSSECALGGPADPGTNRPACRDPGGVFTPSAPQYATPGLAALREAVSDSEFAVSPMVGANLQLLTPRLDVVPGGPRAFVTGELLTFYGPTRDIAKEGSPSAVGFPPPVNVNTVQNAINVSANGLFGLGSRTRSEIQTLGWGAKAGVAFPFQFRERRLWLKPSVGWMQYSMDVEGTVIAGLKDDGLLRGGDPAVQIPEGDFLERGPGIRAINLAGSASKTFNGIGPGLELEMETGRFGPFGISVFVSAQAFAILGDRSISFSDSIRCDPDPSVPSSGCTSGLVNAASEFGNLNPQQLPNPNPPPFFLNEAGPEDIISPAGPVPDVGRCIGFEMCDPSLPMSDIAPLLPFGADDYSASWSFDVDEWGYRAGVGIRLNWLGR